MRCSRSSIVQLCRVWVIFSCFCTAVPAATQSKKLPVVGRWARFEYAFKSSVGYSNPLREADLKVLFTSPQGETTEVYGFWDGGKVWRVRFCPTQLGRWTFISSCSDAANKGLHQRAGEFLCTAPTGASRFSRHGPVRVARDRRHLEHADGTPFFWLADTAWEGARLARAEEWDGYARVRAAQQFTVIQWSGAPGRDSKGQSAFNAARPNELNPIYFQRLDDRLESLSRSGLLSAIVPFAEGKQLFSEPRDMADDQIALLARYMIARWGTEPVAWVIAPDAKNPEASIERWRRLGQALFASGERPPVVLMLGQEPTVWQSFRQADWIDACAYDVTKSPVESSEPPTGWSRPLIACLPHENSLTAPSGKRTTADDVRRSLYRSVCVNGTAGINYGAQGIVHWNANTGAKNVKGTTPADWRKAIFMPAAKQMAHLSRLVNSIDYWKLQPNPKLLSVQPGEQAPQRSITAAQSEAKDMTLVYVPEDRTLDLMIEALPPSPNITWWNPRTGENSPAVAVVGGQTCQFPTPDAGDWLLVIKEGK